MVHTWVSGSAATVSVSNKRIVTTGAKAVRNRTSNWVMARGLFFLFAFLVLFSGFSFVHTFASSDRVVPATGEDRLISVDSGDTLWELASAYKKDSVDTRDAVRSLMKRNDLTDASLKSGQTLIVPASILP